VYLSCRDSRECFLRKKSFNKQKKYINYIHNIHNANVNTKFVNFRVNCLTSYEYIYIHNINITRLTKKKHCHSRTKNETTIIKILNFISRLNDFEKFRGDLISRIWAKPRNPRNFVPAKICVLKVYLFMYIYFIKNTKKKFLKLCFKVLL